MVVRMLSQRKIERSASDRAVRWPAMTLALLLAASSCGSSAPEAVEGTEPPQTTSSTQASTSVPASATSPTVELDEGSATELVAEWVETEVSFETDLGTIYGTLTQPSDAGSVVAAVLIIGGSGPTDRDGNSPGIPGSVGSLSTVAHWLAADGVASLRYDKLGSGATGLGNLTPATMTSVAVEDYLAINAEALRFLSETPRVDPSRLGIVGHSEGAMFALLLGAGGHANVVGVPEVQGMALVAPLSIPILDLLRNQVASQVDGAVAAGQITTLEGIDFLGALDGAIESTRSNDELASDLPPPLVGLFNESTISYLRTQDVLDPRVLAADLPEAMTVLVTCSDADIQISCDDVTGLTEQLDAAVTDMTFVQLVGVAHSLKVDPSGSPASYGADLPFSPVLQEALTEWVSTCC